MAIIKCKICGGDLAAEPGSSIAECEYCGTRQTVPAADDEKKLTLFSRANRLRLACEFDKAAGIYETIVADFPQEAEAYWGLVLCRYGIEYVDDPATGKKVPTCHRSSFESVMDDGDFEQAQENADAVARKLYREEAKQIEQLRKGIIEVSGRESPCDIFICYKETDENGDRTLDSVLAQDIYGALTDKGYRVFFARISLEDKLGLEYEPYIFAALNSARIMLAVGTDYEHFNAVWVKNEWSRFLKLMEKDKTKHLIPCFKGLDAYDIPREFNKLQAQDLGKVGALQDLLRGIEKLLPRQPEVAYETVTVPGGADAAPLLRRAEMFLEDGDWSSADEYCEKVLDLDPEHARAYILKALAVARCADLMALARNYLNTTAPKQPRREVVAVDPAVAEAAAQTYAIPGYYTCEEIRRVYESFDAGYSALLPVRAEQLSQGMAWWDNHRQLSKAVKFAEGQDAQQLAQARAMLQQTLEARLAEAEAEDQTAIQAVLDKYAKLEPLVKAQSEAASVRREQDYNACAEGIEQQQDIQQLERRVQRLRKMQGYRDAGVLIAQCHGRITHLRSEKRARLDQMVQNYEKQREKTKKRIIGAIVLAAVAAIALYIVFGVVLP